MESKINMAAPKSTSDFKVDKVVEPKSFKGRRACDWSIEGASEEGIIKAENSRTKETFEGSIKEFNDRLRG